MAQVRESEPAQQKTELGKALQACRSSFLYAGFFSFFVNILVLVPTFYMLAVYDKVLASSSESTLLMLTIITVFLFIVMGGLEWIRSQILIATGTRLDQMLSNRVFNSIFSLALASGGKTATSQPLSDLLQLRQFLTGNGLFAFFDAPWLPIYLLLLFLFHFWFGIAAVVSALILIGLAIWNEVSTRSDLKEANQEAISANQYTQSNLRNAEVIEVMGMLPHIRKRWEEKQQTVLTLQARASAKGGLINAISKTFRMTIQSLVLGLGAYLAIHKEISPGLVISGSILLGRALAPLDLMISGWRGFHSARDSYNRLNKLLPGNLPRETPLPLPEPKGEIRLENVSITPQGLEKPILKDISILIEPGNSVAVLGPSAAGKSTLARTILGIYKPSNGNIRLDGADIHNWERVQRGGFLGYLPQDVELLDGTISENIARFGEIDPDKIIEAAQMAGIHEMILQLPEGYETRIVGNGYVLSTGQRQRLGIARAVYGNPKVVVLDEPNSNLDQAGESALMNTLIALKRKGTTVIVVAHRTQIVTQVDKILVLVEGKVAFYGDRDEGLGLLGLAPQTAPKPATPQPAAPVPVKATAPVAKSGGGLFKY